MKPYVQTEHSINRVAGVSRIAPKPTRPNQLANIYANSPQPTRPTLYQLAAPLYQLAPPNLFAIID